jgi:type IV pilus assembly protein PilC
MAAQGDLVVFYRTLAEMLRAGMVASVALDSCAHVVPVAGDAARVVEQGQPLSEAFARFPRIFPADQVRLLQVAERSGSVDATLSDLADYAGEMIRARRTIVSGLMLPAVVIHVAALVLPLPGLILGSGVTGYLVSSLGFLAVIWGAVGAVVLFARRASPDTLDAVLRKIPVAGEAWRELQRWRMASALRMLMRTSLDMPASLRFAAEVCHSAQLTATLRVAADAAERNGEPASVSLRASGALPPDVLALWRNGEQTGGLDATFTRLANRFAESFNARLQVIAAWFPRIIYFVVTIYLVVQILKLGSAYAGRLNGL